MVNDRVGSTDLVVVFDRRQATAKAWARDVDGRLLTFAPDDVAAPDGGPALVDLETATRWSGLSGEAFEGKLAGSQLLPLPATPMFWFAWTDFFPSAPLWEPPP